MFSTLFAYSCDLFRTWQVPPQYDQSAVRKWKPVGKTQDGALVYINTESITYSSLDIISTDAKTVVRDKEFIDRLEFDCPRYRFRIVERYSVTKSRWRGIIVGSPSKIIHNELCPRIK
jgi:hypothetical protein